jgi:hypothetical protein
MEKKKLETGHDYWEIDLRDKKKKSKKKKDNIDHIKFQLEEGLKKQSFVTVYDTDGNIMDECTSDDYEWKVENGMRFMVSKKPKDTYSMFVTGMGEDGKMRTEKIEMPIPEDKCTFYCCQPKKDSNKE